MREGTKTFKFFEMMRRPEGVTFKELLEASDGQKENTMRGFLASNKKRGVASFKREDGTRAYHIVDVPAEAPEAPAPEAEVPPAA